MADVVLSRAGVPVLTKNQGIWLDTGSVANGDDLVLTEIEQPAHRYLLLTPAVAATDLNSITNGAYTGQMVTLMVANGNTLGLPLALANVDSTADLDATKDAPVTIMWNGTNWQAAG